MSAAADRPRVVVLRGIQANPWELRAWSMLQDDFDVEVLIAPANAYDLGEVGVRQTPVYTVGSRLPANVVGRLATRAIGDRYIGLAEWLRNADIVHAAELGFWFSMQAARQRRRLGFRLALTVWETLPFLDAYRNVRTRRYRRSVLAETDLFLPTTERAAEALRLEGAPDDRIVVSPPGIDVDAFASGRTPTPSADGRHVIVSPARLVWEKGHQDVLRAVALLRRRGRDDVRVVIVGTGPEEGRLRAVARDLGLADRVEFRGSVAYPAMPAVYAEASCLVLGSMPTPFWEEQFGMVLAEAMAAHLPVVAAASGAIPEVVGQSGTLFMPGDYVGLADALAAGPLAGAPGARRAPEPERLERFSNAAAAGRLRAAYTALLAR